MLHGHFIPETSVELKKKRNESLLLARWLLVICIQLLHFLSFISPPPPLSLSSSVPLSLSLFSKKLTSETVSPCFLLLCTFQALTLTILATA